MLISRLEWVQVKPNHSNLVPVRPRRHNGTKVLSVQDFPMQSGFRGSGLKVQLFLDCISMVENQMFYFPSSCLSALVLSFAINVTYFQCCVFTAFSPQRHRGHRGGFCFTTYSLWLCDKFQMAFSRSPSLICNRIYEIVY